MTAYKGKWFLTIPLVGVGIFLVLKSCGNMTTANTLGTSNVRKRPVPLIPVEDFFKNPEKTSFSISPDGTSLAYLAPYHNRLNIYVKNMNTGAEVRITDDTLRDIRQYQWVNDNRLVYLQDVGGDENYKLYATNREGNYTVCLTCFPGVRTEIINGCEDSPKDILISMNMRDPAYFDVYKLNIESGALDMMAQNPGNIISWIADHKSIIRAAVATDGLSTHILYRDNAKSEFRNILTFDYKHTVEPLFFTFDNQKLYCLSNLGRDKSALVVINPKTGSEEDVVFSHFAYDVAGAGYSCKRKTLTEAYYTSWKKEVYYFDQQKRHVHEALLGKLPGYEIYITDSDKDENHYVIRTYNDKTMGAYYLYNNISGELKKIADVAPWLKEDHMAEMEPVYYKSRDGQTIYGYLTVPVGSTKSKLPVIVNPHGGPWYRNSWGFNPEVQFLANRGYAVLQINYRGSTGYGKAFCEASYKQWGGKMQDDIVDGVRWLIDKGYADPEKIAIYGSGYGGYAALMGLVKSPDLFACGINHSGPTNLYTFMNSIPAYWAPYRMMMSEMVGDPVKDSAMFRTCSPYYNISSINAPVMIVQGQNDLRVPKGETDQFVMRLREKNVEVEYVVKENEGQGFFNEENRMDFYRQLETFLGQHLKHQKPDLP